MAIIHLYTKGFEDDLDNFTLTLTSPSTQAEMLKVQNWKEKIQLYRDAVSDAGNGFGAMSMTYAKKEILNMSDDEIKLDIQRQAVEKAGGEEVKALGETIKQTGIYDIFADIICNESTQLALFVNGNPLPSTIFGSAPSGLPSSLAVSRAMCFSFSTTSAGKSSATLPRISYSRKIYLFNDIITI
mgnify:CR=1 FL=1